MSDFLSYVGLFRRNKPPRTLMSLYFLYPKVIGRNNVTREEGCNNANLLSRKVWVRKGGFPIKHHVTMRRIPLSLDPLNILSLKRIIDKIPRIRLSPPGSYCLLSIAWTGLTARHPDKGRGRASRMWGGRQKGRSFPRRSLINE